MIKINLLPTRAAKKKAPIGREFLYIGLALFVVEAVLLYFWWNATESKLKDAQAGVTDLRKKVETLQRVKQEIAATEELRHQLEAQNYILDQLKDAKVGPPNMLLFLTYAVSNPVESAANRDELKALERAGWNLQWDPDSVWLRKIDEEPDGKFSLDGEARSHEDVAEFYRRLRSSIYFRDVQPGAQMRMYDAGIEMKYVAFHVSMALAYHVATVASTETPPAESGSAGTAPAAGPAPGVAAPAPGATPAAVPGATPVVPPVVPPVVAPAAGGK